MKLKDVLTWLVNLVKKPKPINLPPAPTPVPAPTPTPVPAPVPAPTISRVIDDLKNTVIDANNQVVA